MDPNALVLQPLARSFDRSLVMPALGPTPSFLRAYDPRAMKHYSGFLLATLLATAEVHAQLQQTCMVVDGYFYYLSEAGFVQTADGGFASAGPFSETNDGYNEIGVTRFDANGELLWLRKWTTGANDNIFPQALVATADGGLVLAGIDQATPPQSGWFIMKLDASGTLQWSKNYDSPTFSLIGSLYADGFRQTSDGGFAVVAFKQFPDHGFCMFRTDANGELLWSDEIRYTGTLCDIAELPNGDLVIAGESNNDATLLARKDGLTGVTEWVHWYSCTTEDFTPFAVTAGPDSTIVVSGRCSGYMPGDFGSIGAMALDAQGTPQWMTKVVTADEAQGFEVARDPTGGWVIAGHTTVPLPGSGELAPSVTKLSETGLLEWSKRYAFTPGIVNSWFSRISFADDGDLLVTGRTAAVNSYVQRLLKLAPDGIHMPLLPCTG